MDAMDWFREKLREISTFHRNTILSCIDFPLIDPPSSPHQIVTTLMSIEVVDTRLKSSPRVVERLGKSTWLGCQFVLMANINIQYPSGPSSINLKCW